MDDIRARKKVIASHVSGILEAMNEPLREGLKDTPRRVADMFIDEVGRNGKALEDEVRTIFLEETHIEELILVRDIPLASFCEHHLLPWFGKVHVGYIPDKGIVGLSKIARVVQAAGKGFTIQERVTNLVANTLDEVLKPVGVMVVVEAVHSCMVMRGIRAIGSSTVTSALRGIFKDSSAARSEFLSLMRSNKSV